MVVGCLPHEAKLQASRFSLGCHWQRQLAHAHKHLRELLWVGRRMQKFAARDDEEDAGEFQDAVRRMQVLVWGLGSLYSRQWHGEAWQDVGRRVLAVWMHGQKQGEQFRSSEQLQFQRCRWRHRGAMWS